MHFPWKMVRSAKISQFVNDHLHHSQKRRDGSSLVVETGFPTSLVDLFMKNREKLKKPSKKKRQRLPITPNSDSNDSPTAAASRSVCSSPFAPSSPMSAVVIAGSSAPSSPMRCASPLRPSSLPSKGRHVNRFVESCDGAVDSVDPGVEKCVDANSLLMVVLKMFLVVVLALGSQRLTVGITVSAFLLFFMEFVGKYVCGANGMLCSMLQTVWRLLRYKEVNLDENNRGISIPEMQQDHSLKSNESRNLNQEIQVVEPERYLTTRLDEINPETETTENETTVRRLLGYTETGEKEDVVAETKRKSKRARIKSKMRKFVPKKMRISRKHHIDDNSQRPEITEDNTVLLSDDSQRSGIVREDNVLLCDENGVCETGHEGESESARSSSFSSGNYYTEEDSKRGISYLSPLSNIREVESQEKVPDQIGYKPTWRYLILCQIVLVGLIGGRGYALALTLSWCLVLKFSQILARYMKRVPIIRSFSEKSG